MTKHPTSILAIVHLSSATELISGWVTHWKTSHRNGAAPLTATNYAHKLHTGAPTCSLSDNDRDKQQDHSVVSELGKGALGRALLGLAMAVGSSGRP